MACSTKRKRAGAWSKHARAHPTAPQGIVMSITITTVAACETAIGLALCVTYFHLRSATDVEALNFLK